MFPIAHQPIDLLGEQATRLRQGLTNHRDCERRTRHNSQYGIGKLVNAFRMNILIQNTVEEFPDITKSPASALFTINHLTLYDCLSTSILQYYALGCSQI